MTYTSGSLIQATDYNGFVSTNAANINGIYSTGVTSKGYGQTAIATVSTGGTVTATQWASLVNTLAAVGSHTNTTLTARSAPTAGTLISILANVATDITNVTTNSANAVASGTQYTAWTGTNSKTAATGAGSWTITITNTVTFASADAARYFFNAGGIIKLQPAKSSTGNTGDPPWNTLATNCGSLYFTGLGTSKTIAATAYTGTTVIGSTGTPATYSSGTGFYSLTPGGAATVLWKLNSPTAPYTADYIQHTVALNAASTVLTFVTTWVGTDGDPISGGTAPTGATPGTAPCTICTYFPPSTTYLSNSWGTPTVAATTA